MIYINTLLRNIKFLLLPKDKITSNKVVSVTPTNPVESCDQMSELVRFGVVADVQYADNEDRPAWYDMTKTRYYRNALQQVYKAFQHWNQQELENKKIGFVLQLGDIIDGINVKSLHDTSLDAIRRTLNQFECNPHIPTFHAVGNHELYNFKRKELAQLFQESLLKRMHVNSELIGLNGLKLLPENGSDEMSLHYKFTPSPGVKLISIDCFDISVLGHDPNTPQYIKAAEILHQHHGVHDWDVWDSGHNLVGSNRRFQSSNGAVGEEQLKWLENQLEESDSKNELVIVFGHVGIHPDSSDWDTTIWNYDEVIACFNRHPSVVAYLCGHAHNHGYANANGVHYVTFQAIIETSPDTESFATITLFEDRLEIEGHGLEQSRTLYLQKSFITDEEVMDELLHEEVTTNPTVEVEV